jgi:hypothetical protein
MYKRLIYRHFFRLKSIDAFALLTKFPLHQIIKEIEKKKMSYNEDLEVWNPCVGGRVYCAYRGMVARGTEY